MPRLLSEAASKEMLSPYGIPFAPDAQVTDAAAAVEVARRVGYPVVAKLCGATIAHKTERGLVRLGLAGDHAVAAAVDALLGEATPEDGEVSVLIAPMVTGSRELICGISRDPAFGPTLMVGIGGIMAEALGDVAVRLVPAGRDDGHDMLDQLRHQALLDAFRGEPAVDRNEVVDVLVALNAVAVDRPDVISVDLNPLIISAGRPVAVDALVELDS